ncbi:hypothetical protein H311_00891 [Anncaliia algerae PRA109]|nr:hypothetical protein H311_00891 [Anncaliia algerae PRA109]
MITMLLYILHVLSSLKSKENKELEIHARGNPYARFAITKKGLRLVNLDTKQNVLLIPNGKNEYSIAVDEKIICHLVDNTVDQCKNGYNKGKSFVIKKLPFRGYLIKSKVKNEMVKCLKHTDLSDKITLTNCNDYDESLRWDIKEDGEVIINGYELNKK